MLQNYSKKILRLFYLTPIFLFLYLYSLPWAPPFEIWTDHHEGKVGLTLEKSNGDSYTKIYDLKEHSMPIKLAAVTLLNVKTSSQEIHLTARFEGRNYLLQNNDHLKLPSKRNDPNVLRSIFLSVLFFSYFIFAALHFLKKLNPSEARNTLLIFLMHLFLLGLVLYTNFPGHFNWDSFDNFWAAANYQISTFTGSFYSSMFMAAYQLIPEVYVLSIFNLLLITIALTYLFHSARNLQVLPYYLISCLVFYIYPASLIMNLMVNRDVAANWFLLLTFYNMYFFFTKNSKHTLSRCNLLFLVLLTCLIRTENIYILPLGLVFLTFKFSRKDLKWSLAATSIIILMSIGISFNQSPDWQKNKIVYQTTALINPLSFILSRLYKDKLPAEINARLGTYYKNQYLIDYNNEDDIPSFHHGGVNKDFTIEAYKQFKFESLKIFSENPILFLENRIRVSSIMFGFSEVLSGISQNEYHLLPAPFLRETKNNLNFPEHPSMISRISEHMNLINYPKGVIFRSYLIPILVISLCVIGSFKTPIFRCLFAILCLRTLLVCLTSPAGYFKYNYIVWLFSLFILPLFVWERRSNLDKTVDTV